MDGDGVGNGEGEAPNGPADPHHTGVDSPKHLARGRGKLAGMNDGERQAQIRRYWESTGNGPHISDEIYHDDAVLEFPQSGERFEGVANFREWRSQYPASVTLEMRDLRGQGNLWVVEGSISYDGGPSQPAVNILEFRGDKVARETIYVTEPWEAPEWRARWRAEP
jgi:SnoaL-like domain